MTGIVIQARMGSTRLPGKVLMKIGDRDLLGHILDRLKLLKVMDCQVVVATSIERQDDEIERFCQKEGVPCFRGSEKNVLERYWLCARQYQFDNIVRLTADNPFIDIEELEHLILFHSTEAADYSYSDTELPVGMGAEIFSMDALSKTMKKANKDNHFEHVDDYILENKNQFKCRKLDVDQKKIHPEISFTIDTVEDYKKACYIAEHALNKYFGVLEACDIYYKFGLGM